MDRPKDTSWQKVSKQYNESVGEAGNYFHQNVIIPGVIKLLNLQPNDSVLDLGCGQGVLARQLPKTIFYQGVDLARDLIEAAQKMDHNPLHRFVVGNITKSLPINKTDFTAAAIVLALQNIENPQETLNIASKHLRQKGKLVMVINHPCFRIPRQSSWAFEEERKIQYRRIDRYLSPIKIPINSQPSKGEHGVFTWSFHYPLESYSEFLNKAGFVIETIEEWASDKTSQGRLARMENRARAEIPLFMAILASKK